MAARRTATRGQRVTPREQLVLDGLRKRLSNDEIAVLLGVSVRTVETHVASVLTKFGVTSRRDLLREPEVVELTSEPGDAARPRASSHPVEIALLDRAGVIRQVNRPWIRFCLDNGGQPRRVGPGVSYLDVCARSGDPDSLVVADAIRAAASGGVFVPYRFLMPCPTTTQERWYDLLISSRVDDDGSCVGVTVAFRRTDDGGGSPDGRSA